MDARFTASDASRMVRAGVDHTGLLVDLRLEPDLLLQPAVAVQRATLDAIVEAQQLARAGSVERESAVAGLVVRRVAADVRQASDLAERGLAELNTIVSDLLRAGTRP